MKLQFKAEMEKVPKVVTDRLKVSVRSVNHPDADVLTAFSERSLPEAERDIVLEHLATCGDCREIVALALPGVETVEKNVHPAPSGWLTWPVLRWGFIAAGVVAIASFGIVQYRRPSGSPRIASSAPRAEGVAKEAKNQPPVIPAATESGKKPETMTVPAAAAPAVAADRLDASGPAAFDKIQAANQPSLVEGRAKKTIGGAIGGPIQHGPRVQYQSPNSFQNNLQNNARVPAVPPPYAKQVPNALMPAGTSVPAPVPPVAVQAGATRSDTQEAQTQEALALPRTNMPLQPTEGGQGQVSRAKPEPGMVVVSSAKVPGGSLPSPTAASSFALSAPNASWTITAGSLQRSLDQGKTWQDVNVSSAPPAGANYALTASVANEKAADNKKDLALKRVVAPPVFRAVAANGADVWAGGSSGMLYHSTDSGAHWTRIVPFSGTVILTGDIVRLDFPDTQHGKITTSAPEVWLTSDGGQTWLKQ